MGNALPTFTEPGYGYAVEKAPTTAGWTYPVFEELWNYGFPQEMEHFAHVHPRPEEAQIAPARTAAWPQELHGGRVTSRPDPGAASSSRSGPRAMARPIDLWFDPLPV